MAQTYTVYLVDSCGEVKFPLNLSKESGKVYQSSALRD